MMCYNTLKSFGDKQVDVEDAGILRFNTKPASLPVSAHFNFDFSAQFRDKGFIGKLMS
jgi:hypothetical protein